MSFVNMVKLVGMFGLASVLLTPSAHAQDVMTPVVADAKGEQKIQSIRLEMLVVHATTANKAVDPQVRPLMKYFRNYKFTGFSLLDSQTAKINDNSARTFEIEGNRSVTITMLSHTEKSAKLKMVIVEDKGKKILDTTVNINRNGTFIVAGPKFKEGVLFLPISAKY
jgi:hypothetical protein